MKRFLWLAHDCAAVLVGVLVVVFREWRARS